uniref:Uncharacterized protein n=1 Tax=Anguilla anguilla TaxID=7936 RepID=A0A0E9R591_ANGAN
MQCSPFPQIFHYITGI